VDTRRPVPEPVGAGLVSVANVEGQTCI
jgi:hypothetical protein